MLVHAAAETLGLSHVSRGDGAKRTLTLYKPATSGGGAPVGGAAHAETARDAAEKCVGVPSADGGRARRSEVAQDGLAAPPSQTTSTESGQTVETSEEERTSQTERQRQQQQQQQHQQPSAATVTNAAGSTAAGAPAAAARREGQLRDDFRRLVASHFAHLTSTGMEQNAAAARRPPAPFLSQMFLPQLCYNSCW
eukprot:1804183-Pleurochrysis_carterae.AAC.4